MGLREQSHALQIGEFVVLRSPKADADMGSFIATAYFILNEERYKKTILHLTFESALLKYNF